MHCILLAILSRLSQFPSPTVCTNWPFCVDVLLKNESISRMLSLNKPSWIVMCCEISHLKLWQRFPEWCFQAKDNQVVSLHVLCPRWCFQPNCESLVPQDFGGFSTRWWSSYVACVLSDVLISRSIFIYALFCQWFFINFIRHKEKKYKQTLRQAFTACYNTVFDVYMSMFQYFAGDRLRALLSNLYHATGHVWRAVHDHSF